MKMVRSKDVQKEATKETSPTPTIVKTQLSSVNCQPKPLKPPRKHDSN